MAFRPEVVAAAVNGLLVCVLPLGVSPDGGPFRYATALWIASVSGPLGVLVAWRTYVYARAMREHADQGWRSLLEAGACGLTCALIALAPGVTTHPMEAPPYMVFYGGIATLIAFVIGLVLRQLAVAILWVARRFVGSAPSDSGGPHGVSAGP